MYDRANQGVHVVVSIVLEFVAHSAIWSHIIPSSWWWLANTHGYRSILAFARSIWQPCCNSDAREAWSYIIQECHKVYIRVQVWMRAYSSMYRPFRPTAMSGHTRLTSGHMSVMSGHTLAETYHAIHPLLLYFVKQETNEMKHSASHSSFHKTLLKWAGKEFYYSLRMAIHKETKKSACPKVKQKTLKSNLISNHKLTFRDGRSSTRDSISMGASPADLALMRVSGYLHISLPLVTVNRTQHIYQVIIPAGGYTHHVFNCACAYQSPRTVLSHASISAISGWY